MLKQRLFKVLIAFALLAAAAGSTGIVADTLGLAVTPVVGACSTGSSSGGGC